MLNPVSRSGSNTRGALAGSLPVTPIEQHLPPAKFWIAVLDALTVLAALVAETVSANARLSVSVSAFLVVVWASWLFGLYCLGAYDGARSLRPSSSAPAVLASAVVCGAAVFAYVPVRSLWWVSFATVAAFVSMLVSRATVGALLARGRLGIRFAVVGSRNEALEAVRLIEEHPEAGGVVAAALFTDDGPTVNGKLFETASIEALLVSCRARAVVFADLESHDAELLRELRALCYLGITVLDSEALFELTLRAVRSDRIDERWLMRAATHCSRQHVRWTKRVLDLFGAFVLLVITCPFFALAALLVKITSRGPVLFRQERVGRHSRPFNVLKLRTMYEDAEERTGPVWSMNRDPRITPVGRLLRKFRLDELPQLWNVLRGEMSLVGPRPERPVFVEQLSQAIPHYGERHLVRPGITGWAQVMAPYAASLEDSRRKHEYDLYYVKHISFWLDFLIALKTVKTVIFGRERDQGGVQTAEVSEVHASASTDQRVA